MRGAWIEMMVYGPIIAAMLSLPMRGAWIEMMVYGPIIAAMLSLPMRGAWIEILLDWKPPEETPVAPHAGSVD